MLQRFPKRNENDRIGKEPVEHRRAGDIEVVLGHVARGGRVLSAAQEDDLAHVAAKKSRRTRRSSSSLLPGQDAIAAVVPPPERLPQHLLQRLGAVEIDEHPVAVGALLPIGLPGENRRKSGSKGKG